MLWVNQTLPAFHGEYHVNKEAAPTALRRLRANAKSPPNHGNASAVEVNLIFSARRLFRSPLQSGSLLVRTF
jgi:hypothetical protein